MNFSPKIQRDVYHFAHGWWTDMPTSGLINLVIGDKASFQMNARLCILRHCTLCDELISINFGN